MSCELRAVSCDMGCEEAAVRRWLSAPHCWFAGNIMFMTRRGHIANHEVNVTV